MKESRRRRVQPDMTTAAPPWTGTEAFLAAIREHDRALRALAWQLLGDTTRMDDALQEAYIKAYRAWPAFRGGSSAYTWLYRIVYNACLDEIRHGRKVTMLPLEYAESRPAGGPGLDERIAARGDLAAALASLPPEQRAAVLLVDAEGFDYAAAGEVLGVPPGTVGSRVSRARAALRAALGGEYR